MKFAESLLICTVVAAFWSCSPIYVSKKGVAYTKDETDFFHGPDWQYRYFTTRSRDTEVEIIGMKRDWFKVRLPEGATAWTHKTKIMFVQPWRNSYARGRPHLKEGPNSEAFTVLQLSEGEPLTWLNTYGPWYQVALRNGMTGWIHASDVAVQTGYVRTPY